MWHPTRFATAAAAIVVALTVGLSAAPAGAGPRPRVAPNQAFDGLVNGKRAAPGGVTIMVGCVGPITPGETGHPVAGQTVEVRNGPVVSTNSGNTGDAGTEIEAFFGAPPPDTAAASPRHGDAKTTVTFHRYALARAIPAALELPCAGTGQVTFVPFPRSPPTSRPAIVRVRYVGQP